MTISALVFVYHFIVFYNGVIFKRFFPVSDKLPKVSKRVTIGVEVAELFEDQTFYFIRSLNHQRTPLIPLQSLRIFQ